MKPLAKGLLFGCLGLLVILAMVAGFSWWLWHTQGPSLIESGQKAMQEGAQAGATSTGRQCVDQGLAMTDKARSMSDGVRVPLWMQGCLEASPSGREVCPGVPRRSEFTRSLAWRFEECDRRGFDKDQRCMEALSVVQKFCEMPVEDAAGDNRKDG